MQHPLPLSPPTDCKKKCCLIWFQKDVEHIEDINLTWNWNGPWTRYLQLTDQNHRFQRIVHSKVKPTVNYNSHTRDVESAIKPSNAIRFESFLVNIDQTVKLPFTALVCSLGVISQTCSSIIKGINKKERWSASSTTRRQVPGKPLPVTILVFLEIELPFKVIFESKVKGLKKQRYTSKLEKLK